MTSLPMTIPPGRLRTTLFCAAVFLFSLDGLLGQGAVEEHTVYFNSLDSGEVWNLAKDQAREFVAGPFKNTVALRLLPAANPQGGVAILLDTTVLDEGTIEIWFNPDEAAMKRSVILSVGSGGNTVLNLMLENGTLSSFFVAKDPPHNRPIRLRGQEVQVGKWNHAALSWSPDSGVRLYLNGEPVDEQSDPAKPWATQEQEILHIGDEPEYNESDGKGWFESGNNFSGAVANLRVSNIFRKEFPEIPRHPDQ